MKTRQKTEYKVIEIDGDVNHISREEAYILLKEIPAGSLLACRGNEEKR